MRPGQRARLGRREGDGGARADRAREGGHNRRAAAVRRVVRAVGRRAGRAALDAGLEALDAEVAACSVQQGL